MSRDTKIRELERQAATGDPEAAARLCHERGRETREERERLRLEREDLERRREKARTLLRDAYWESVEQFVEAIKEQISWLMENDDEASDATLLTWVHENTEGYCPGQETLAYTDAETVYGTDSLDSAAASAFEEDVMDALRRDGVDPGNPFKCEHCDEEHWSVSMAHACAQNDREEEEPDVCVGCGAEDPDPWFNDHDSEQADILCGSCYQERFGADEEEHDHPMACRSSSCPECVEESFPG